MSDWPALEEALSRSAHERSRRGARVRRLAHAGTLIPAAVVVILMVAIGAVVAGGGRSTRSIPSDERPATVTPTATVIATPTPGSTGPLRVLEQPASAATRLPRAMQSDIAGTAQSGERPARGRKATTTSSGGTFYVVPGARGVVCLEYANPSSSTPAAAACSPQRQVATGTFAGSTCESAQDGGGALFSGLLPNAARHARLVFTDGSTHPVPLSNNVWWARVPSTQAPALLTWTERGSTLRAPVIDAPPGCGPERVVLARPSATATG